MKTFKIEVPTTVEVASRGRTVAVDVSKLTEDIVARLVVHGLTQKVADAAAGAKKIADEEGGDIAEIAEALMQKVATRLEAGDWGAERGAGTSGDPLDKFRVQVLKAEIKKKPSGLLAQKAAEYEGAELRKFLLEVAAKNAEKVDPAAQRLKEIEDRKKAVKIEGGFDI